MYDSRRSKVNPRLLWSCLYIPHPPISRKPALWEEYAGGTESGA